jgi:hypothetical protein
MARLPITGRSGLGLGIDEREVAMVPPFVLPAFTFHPLLAAAGAAVSATGSGTIVSKNHFMVMGSMLFPPYLRLYVRVRTEEDRCYTGLSPLLQALVFKGLNPPSIDRSIFEFSVYIRLIERPAAPSINASGLTFRCVTLPLLNQLFPQWASGGDEVWGAHEFGPNGYGSFDETGNRVR